MRENEKHASERVLEDIISENFQDLEKEEPFASNKICIQSMLILFHGMPNLCSSKRNAHLCCHA